MKLFNIFKKEISKEVISNVQKMDKNQLSKVIGGADGIIIDETSSTKVPPSIRGVVIDK